MTDLSQKFVEAYSSVHSLKTIYTDSFPAEMKASEIDNDGWIEWKPIKGTLQESDYRKLERKYSVLFPKSFINWHKSYYFLDADCSILRLPISSPTRPLEDLEGNLNWFIPEQLIPQNLYPFADDGNDAGPLVFDGREPIMDNEFPIRVYDHEYGGEPEGLSEIIFSSFPKLLECMIHYMVELRSRRSFEIIPDFLQIDPEGAGRTGVDYWLGWTAGERGNFEELAY